MIICTMVEEYFLFKDFVSNKVFYINHKKKPLNDQWFSRFKKGLNILLLRIKSE